MAMAVGLLLVFVALVGCGPEEYRGRATIIYRNGQVADCESLERIMGGDVYVCHQTDGYFRVRAFDIGTIKYHYPRRTWVPKEEPR